MSDSLARFAAESLDVLRSSFRFREPRTLAPIDATHIELDGQRLIDFSSNDYLGLRFHPDVIQSGFMAAQSCGAGAGASRLVSGSHPLYETFESQLAEFKHAEGACVAGSGFLANLAAITGLVGKGDLILADKLSHASLLEAARLSGATLQRFAHNDLEHAEQLLESKRCDFRHCLIVTESVFSMDGDIAPVEALYALSRQYDSWVLVDDAHGLGVLNGGYGASIGFADILTGTLSKALGSYGGYICASQAVISLLLSRAKPLIYTTALPPFALGAASKALELLPSICVERSPVSNAAIFCEHLELEAPQSAIVPVIIGESLKAMDASKQLIDKGFYVQAIRPPTVPEGTARLRITFSSDHDKRDILSLAEEIMSIRGIA